MADRRFLYLHGFASGPNSGKARFFEQRFAALGLRLQVLALDEGNFETLTISRQLELVEVAAQNQAAVLIGSSLGGYLAALYAARHEAVERVILLAPAFRFPTHYPASLGEARLAAWRTSGKLRVFHYGSGRERDLGYEFFVDGRRYEPEPDVRQPALVVHGTRDDVVPPAFSAAWARTHPNAELHLLNAGHDLHNVLDRIWQLTAKFLGFEP